MMQTKFAISDLTEWTRLSFYNVSRYDISSEIFREAAAEQSKGKTWTEYCRWPAETVY
jgi:hypothetical protein